MDASATPRVNAQFLDGYQGRNIMVVGKVQQLRGDSAVLDAAGGVTLLLNRDSHLTVGNGAQVIGKVNQDLTVKVLSSKDLGPNIDMDLANSVVEVSQQFKPVYGVD